MTASEHQQRPDQRIPVTELDAGTAGAGSSSKSSSPRSPSQSVSSSAAGSTASGAASSGLSIAVSQISLGLALALFVVGLIARVRKNAIGAAKAYVTQRENLGHPLGNALVEVE